MIILLTKETSETFFPSNSFIAGKNVIETYPHLISNKHSTILTKFVHEIDKDKWF